MTPLKVNASPLVVTPIALLLLPNVIPPLTVFAEPEVLTSANAPALLTPVPLSVIGLGIDKPFPLILSSAPLVILTGAVLTPNAEELEIFNIPALTVIPLLALPNVLALDKVRVPLPTLLQL